MTAKSKTDNGTLCSWGSKQSCSKLSVYVFTLRLTVIVILLAAAGFAGTFVGRYVNSNERKMTEYRYDFIALHGLNSLRNGFRSRVMGLIALAKAIGYYNPDPAAWPNVTMPGFYDTAAELQTLTVLDSMAFMPIVAPEQLSSFERFMYRYYDTDNNFPPTAGQHNFGKGVYSVDPNNPNGTYHDTTGEALLFESKNKILVPILQLIFSNDSTVQRLTFNIHSDPKYGPAIDAIMDNCSKKYNYSEASHLCGWISDSKPLPVATAEDPDPVINNFRSAIIQPIYLNQDSSQLVGFTGGAINWNNMLSKSFEEYSGLECVVDDGNMPFTYRIEGDGTSFKGLSDLHDPRADRYRRSIYMSTSSAPESGATPYSVHIYPTQSFLEARHTDTAIYAGVGTALIFALFAAVFLLNDVLLRRAASRKGKVLETKRRFVRFVSHEIRTPLNSVHLGLELFTAELNGLVSLLSEPQGSPTARVPTTAAAPPIPCSAETLQILREMLTSWQELAADMIGNGDIAVDVLNDLLNYDKIEMGTLRLDYSAVSIYPLVEKVAKAFQMQARQKEITLKLSGSLWDADQVAELTIQEHERYRNLVVIGDHGRLAQVMRNLLSNALKFTPAGGVVEIKVDWVPAGLPKALPPLVPEDYRDLLELPRAGSVQVRVTDSGVGLSPEQLSQICSEGVQFNANQLQAGKGSGLGLFISKGLVDQHGGKMSVASEGLGRGTTFTVEIPVCSKSSSPSAALLSLRDVPPSPANPNRLHRRAARDSNTSESGSQSVTASERTRKLSNAKRILVVDDAESNRKILIRLLKARGYVCQQAEDGQRGIDLYQALQAKEETVDLIVMDYEMPVMNGPTATKKLRELGCTCLILGVTGNLLPEDVDHFKRQGANAVLGKPLNMKLFDEVLEEFSVTVGGGGQDPGSTSPQGIAAKPVADRSMPSTSPGAVYKVAAESSQADMCDLV